MKVIVLGAGVVGVTTAWFLRRAGHEVTVIDRQAGAGLETSFANGGQISVSHAEPWANPGAPKKILNWLFREDAPLLFRLRADMAQWSWMLKFLRECTPKRTAANIRHLVELGLFSRATLQALRAETGIRYDHSTRGILHFYTSRLEHDLALEPARIMRSHGCRIEMKTADECVAIEPALRVALPDIVGGSMTDDDESGDAHKFTAALAALCAARGVEFRYGTSVRGLAPGRHGIDGVQVDSVGRPTVLLKADAYVVALGAHSRQLLRPHGIHLDIYPAKGYSVTAPVLDPSMAYRVSLTDDEYKLVFSRLGNRLRIAGTAELNGYGMALNLPRCHAIVRRVEQLFPGAMDTRAVEFWTGLRPATPSNVPYVGRTVHPNLFLNTGHGTLGWTLACGSGLALSRLMDREPAGLAFPFTALPAA